MTDESLNKIKAAYAPSKLPARVARELIAALEAERVKVARVQEALAYDSKAHHSDAPCTTRCMDGFRDRVQAAVDGEA